MYNKRKSCPLKALDHFEKYLYDMMEQGLQPMTFEEFRREAMAGMAKAQPEEVEEIKDTPRRQHKVLLVLVLVQNLNTNIENCSFSTVSMHRVLF